MHVAARARLVLARRPWLYWALVIAAAALVAMMVRSQLAAVDQARGEWGATRTVVVASRALEPGEPVEVERIEVPVAVVPPAALDELPADATLRQRVGVGEILTEVDISTRPGPAARAPVGTVVVAISDPLAVHIPLGSSVQIAADGLLVAEMATVTDAIDDVVFVAVAPAVAVAIAAAAHQGLATVLLLP